MVMNVLFIHGIGNHRSSYANATILALKGELEPEDRRAIEWGSAHWSGVLDGRENLLMNRAIAGGDIDWVSLRREYILGGLGDACAYLGDPVAHGRIHQAVADALADFSDPDAPTVLLAHSMGCAVAFDYLHALSSHPVRTAITFGCNLPLFWLGQRPGHLRIPKLRRWYNLYDSDDLLGYPLKQISDQTRAAVTADIRISTGSVLGAHTGYWTDRDFLDWVGKCLTRELRACRLHP